MKFLRTLAVAAALAGAAGLAGCGSDGDSTVTPDGYGRVTVQLTDGPGVDLTDISNLYVTFDRLVVFPVPDSIPPDSTSAPAGIEILTTPTTFDLLSLTNGLAQALGSADIPAGHYRAVVVDLAPDGAWLIEADGDSEDVKVPSGRLRVITDFVVEEGMETEIVLDFDVAASLHLNQTGNGKYILRPVIRQLPPEDLAASISGQVLVETQQGLVPAGLIMVPNPHFGQGHGHDMGNGRRPGDKMGRGRRPDNRQFVPLPVAFPMIVHAAVHGDSADDDSTEALRGSLALRHDDDEDDEDDEDDDHGNVNRPHPRGTMVDPDGDYTLWRVRKGGEYDLRLFLHPRAGFEIVSGPGTLLVNGDLAGQNFVIRRLEESASFTRP